MTVKRVALLTAGGFAPCLSSAVGGLIERYTELDPDIEIIAYQYGYHGLLTGTSIVIDDEGRRSAPILHRFGGSPIGNSRVKLTNVEDCVKRGLVKEGEKPLDVAAKQLRHDGVDVLHTIGGDDTNTAAADLAAHLETLGSHLQVVGLPKTIDNDIFGTDVTFGFHTAVDIATEVIDRIHTTAGSHSRVMCIEIMGNKAGWLTLYSGIAGGADIILLPEMPYDIDRVCEAVERRAKRGSNFSIIAVAEGAMNVEEARMKRKDWMAKRAEQGFGATATNRIAQAVQKKTGMETRVCIPGHMQRGGSPSAYDRVLATEFGSYAAKLVEIERYGVTVAMVNGRVTQNRLADIAGKTRNVPEGCELLTVARRMGVSLG